MPHQDSHDAETEHHDSFLEYINSMLMDETFEDSSWQLLAHNSSTLSDNYQLIYNDFHNILAEDPPAMIDPLFGVRQFHEMGSENCATKHDFGPDGLYAKLNGRKSDAVSNGNGLVPDQFSGETGSMSYASQHKENMLLMDSSEFVVTMINNEYEEGDTVDKGCTLSAAGNMEQQKYRHHGHRQAQSSLRAFGHEVAQEDYVSLVRNADLPAELYAKLFDEWPHLGEHKAALTPSSAPRRSKGRDDAALASVVDLKALILNSAKALSEGNVKKSMELLQLVQEQGASPHGTGLQRVVHYFREAMVARISGMGNTLYAAVANTSHLPSPLMMLRAYKMVFEVCPYIKIAYHFANQYILKAASGASCLHIVDYGILYGFQWPCLIYALANQHGGPPFVRITGIEFPASAADGNPSATTEGTSRRLTEYAKTYNVPFEYHAISLCHWEDIDASSLHISENEVLVINSLNRLEHLHDEIFMHPSPRDKLLRQMCSLNPHCLILGSMNSTHSSPWFAPRFREAFHYYSNMFDAFHTTLCNDSSERLMFERELMGRAILNVVACEGQQRVELPETHKQWQGRVKRAGFRQLPIIPSVWSTAEKVMKGYHKDYSLLHDSNAMLLGWRGRSMQALSAWETASAS